MSMPTKEELTALLCDGDSCRGCVNGQLSCTDCESLEESARLKLRVELEAMSDDSDVEEETLP